MIKFMHLADFHMDMPFSSLSKFGETTAQRRLEQRLAFRKAVEMAKEKKIDIILISGDLFEHEYVSRATILFINECFNSVPDIKVFISPGNHDPYIINSYYNTHEWAPNVHIFKGELEKVSLDNLDACIYGVGFNDFLLHTSKISNLKIEDTSKINILITHATLDNISSSPGYHSISSSQLENLGLDYIALGHIHKLQFGMARGKAFYPGSAIALGFGETGEHGVIFGELEKGRLNYEFVSIDNRAYITLEVDVTGCDTLQLVTNKIIESLNIKPARENYCKIFVTGAVRPEIMEEINLIEEMVFKITGVNNILFLYNLIPEYDYNTLMKGNDLKALFVKKLIYDIEHESDDREKERLKKALNIGMAALESRKVLPL